MLKKVGENVRVMVRDGGREGEALEGKDISELVERHSKSLR